MAERTISLCCRSAAVLVSLCAVLLTGCAGQTKLREAELGELVQMLPGRYDNRMQYQEDVRAGRDPHQALVLDIVPVYAPALSKDVFYVHETAADDERRVISQRLISFQVVKDVGIVQTLWAFAEPQRWRDGNVSPDLFKSMMVSDVSALGGCDLVWKKAELRFTATNDRTRCRVNSRNGAGLVPMESRIQLGPEELGTADVIYDNQGRVIQGHAEEPFYRFRKNGG